MSFPVCRRSARASLSPHHTFAQERSPPGLSPPWFYPYTEVCSCRRELACFAGKISKNRLICKNAVALVYYGSCRLMLTTICRQEESGTYPRWSRPLPPLILYCTALHIKSGLQILLIFSVHFVLSKNNQKRRGNTLNSHPDLPS